MDRIKPKWRAFLISALLGTLTLATFWPVVHNGFSGWDDSSYVTENPHVLKGLTWQNVGWALQTGCSANWHPVTWLSHMLDIDLFGLKPGGHHLVSLLLHATNSVLLFLLLRRWTGAEWRSAMVAALFALHPLHVESVAWVAERKDVLSTLFFLLTLGAYAAYVARLAGPAAETPSEPNATDDVSRFTLPAGGLRSQASRWYALALLLFALGLMSKPMLATLPFVLLMLDFWPLQRLSLPSFRHSATPLLRLLLEKVPFLCLTIISSLVTLLVQAQGHAVKSGLAFGPRFANALSSYLKHLGKTFYPTDLVIFYPHPSIRRLSPDPAAPPAAASAWLQGPIIVAACVLGAISLLSLLRLRRQPWPAVGWFRFLGTLVPVIGLVQVGRQALADRYTYIPLIGIFLCLVWGAAELFGALRLGRRALAGAAIIVLAGCIVLTRNQVRYWRNATTVFAHALAVTPDNPLAHVYIGQELREQGKYDFALAHLREAIAEEPSHAEAYANIALILLAQGKAGEAMEQCRAALRVRPWYDWAHNQLGELLWALGRRDEARTEFANAVRLNPDNARAHYNLATAWSAQGKLPEAARQLAAAVWLKPGWVEALTDLGWALAGQGKMQEAKTRFREAAHFCPTNANLHVTLGSVLMLAGQTNEASISFSNALRLEPGLADKFRQAGDSLAAGGQFSPALDQLRIALWLQPGNAEVQVKLAWILATAPRADLRNGPEAVRLAQLALKSGGGKDPRFWAALDAAYAEAARFTEAIAAAEKVRDLASAAGNKDAAKAAEARLVLYQIQQAYHQSTPN